MPVRRVSSTRYSGYGSFGQTVLVNALQTSTSLRSEANNMIQFRPEADSPSDPVLHIFTQIFWRWKFSLLRVDADALQIFNAPTRKKRLGTVLVEHLNYCTDEIYINYDNQMSQTYVMLAKFSAASNWSQDEDIPCDEPPSDAEIQLVENAGWAASSWLPLVGRFPLDAGQVSVMLGDKVTFYPEKGVDGYIFGGSYQYTHVTISQSSLTPGDNPPLINI